MRLQLQVVLVLRPVQGHGLNLRVPQQRPIHLLYRWEARLQTRSLLNATCLRVTRSMPRCPASVCMELLEVSTKVAWKEVPVKCLEAPWWQKTVEFWNRLAAASHTSVYRRIAMAAISTGVHNWGWPLAGVCSDWAVHFISGQLHPHPQIPPGH